MAKQEFDKNMGMINNNNNGSSSNYDYNNKCYSFDLKDKREMEVLPHGAYWRT